MKVELIFTEPVLGTVSGNPEITAEFIASKHPDGIGQEEVDAVPELEEELHKTATVFARDKDDKPMLWDYVIKGFFKAACVAMIDSETIKAEDIRKARLGRWMYKRTIDQQIFVTPRRIPLQLSGELTFCERPLRAETMKGERIALARSEEAPEGTKIEFEVITLNKKLEPYIEIWLKYGALSGIGCWRNSGKGRFIYKIIS